MNTRFVTLATAAALVGLAAGFLTAGPLNPPAGPVAGTYKTLSEVEPRIPISTATTPGNATSLYRITQPGSYYLTGNITGAPGKHTIEIAAGNVSIDMCGFVIDNQATPGSSSFSGIVVNGSASPDHITIRNGIIQNCGRAGASLVYSQNSGFGSILKGVQARNCGTGFLVGYASRIRNCTAFGNADIGFFVVQGNLESCTATVNQGIGISMQAGIATHCQAYSNTGAGIEFVNGTMSACTTAGNTGGGIRAFASIVEGCTSYDGIRVANRSVARNNLCSRAGNTAMEVDGSDNRIEGNTFTNSTFGLAVLDPGNIIIRNTASGNTINWSIVAGNALAPIIQASTNASTTNGNTYSGNLGSTDPNANFTY